MGTSVLLASGCGPSLPAETGPPHGGAAPGSARPTPPVAPATATAGSDAPHPHQGSETERSASAGQAADSPPRLSDVLARDPRGDDRCPAPFPSFWTWDARAADADANALRKHIWLAPGQANAPPVVAADQPRAVQARCIAVGPHRGLNLANWCCRAAATARTAAAPSGATGLVATLAVEQSLVAADAELVVTVAIENRVTTPQELDMTVATAAVLLLEVRSSSGKPVPTIPPPTPPAQRAIVQLPPHGGRLVQHRLSVFSPPLPPGAYTVRVRGPGIASGTLDFRIAPRTQSDDSQEDSEHRRGVRSW